MDPRQHFFVPTFQRASAPFWDWNRFTGHVVSDPFQLLLECVLHKKSTPLSGLVQNSGYTSSVVVPEHKEAAKTVATVSTDVVWTGTPKELFFFLLHYGLLNAITFGIYTPWFICHFLEFYYERSTFDGRHYAFEAGGKDLFHAGWKWVLFTALTFGIYAFWAFGHFMKLSFTRLINTSMSLIAGVSSLLKPPMGDLSIPPRNT